MDCRRGEKKVLVPAGSVAGRGGQEEEEEEVGQDHGCCCRREPAAMVAWSAALSPRPGLDRSVDDVSPVRARPDSSISFWSSQKMRELDHVVSS